MSLQPPESSLFAQLEDVSPVGVTNTMFFEATEDYLGAIRVGLSVSRAGQAQACKTLARKAELMGSAVQMLALTLHIDSPDTATTKLANAIYLNERMQYATLEPYITHIKAHYENEGVFLSTLRASLNASSARGESEREALSQVAKDILLLNAHAWMRTLRLFGVLGGS